MYRNAEEELSEERKRFSSSQVWPVAPLKEAKTEASWHCLHINRARFSRIWQTAELGASLVPAGHLCITHTRKLKPLFLFSWIEWHTLSLGSFFFLKSACNYLYIAAFVLGSAHVLS